MKNDAYINTSIEQLKSKLNNFTVVDGQGELIGTVRTLAVDDNRQLNLTVSHLSPIQTSRLCLLPSKLIQKVDAQNKVVLLNFNKNEIEHLPEYKTPESAISELAKSLNITLNLALVEVDEKLTAWRRWSTRGTPTHTITVVDTEFFQNMPCFLQ